MKTRLMCILMIVLLVAACSSSKTTPVGTTVATNAVQVQGSEDTVEPTAKVTEPVAVARATGTNSPSEKLEETAASVEASSVDPPAATYTPYPTYTPTVTDVQPVGGPIAETITPAETHAEAIAPTVAPTEAPAPPPAQALPVNVSAAPVAQSVELTRIPDTDPGPPFTILVSAVRTAENGSYKVTGTVRNDSADGSHAGEIYGGVGVIATFFTELECGERYVQSWGGRGQPPSGSVENVCDPNWFGPVKVYAACSLLEPGAECPFSLEIYGREYVAYHLHPEGTPVEYRQPASLAVSNLDVSNTGLGTVRITGTATNGNPFTVRNANIAGTLIDAAGQIVSVGSTLVLGEIAPGASVSFDLRIEYEPYAHYQLHAQAQQN